MNGARRTALLLGLTGLLIVGGYFGQGEARRASVTLPVVRVTPKPSANPSPEATQAPVPEAKTEATQAPATIGFDAYRADLTAARATAASLLDEVILSEDASAATVREALARKAELARTGEIEATIETILRAYGFEGALCTARAGSVNVIVRSEALTQQQAARILEVASRESGEPASNIKIIPSQ